MGVPHGSCLFKYAEDPVFLPEPMLVRVEDLCAGDVVDTHGGADVVTHVQETLHKDAPLIHLFGARVTPDQIVWYDGEWVAAHKLAPYTTCGCGRTFVVHTRVHSSPIVDGVVCYNPCELPLCSYVTVS